MLRFEKKKMGICLNENDIQAQTLTEP